MRALTLHVSALNDYEYDSYTDALNDLTADRNNLPTSDDSYDRIAVGVREVRAWLRGRYATVPVTDVDAILKLFYPNLNQKDMLNGGQFFAVMRLVMHAKDGKGVDKGFAFVQAHPEGTTSDAQSSSKSMIPLLNRRFSHTVASTVHPIDNNPFHATSHASTSNVPISMHPQRPPTHPDMTLPSPPMIAALAPPPKSTNPFLSRSKSESRPNGNNDSNLQKLPPLPPRKPTSLLASSQIPSPPPTRPPIFPPSNPLTKNLKTTHVLSPLMKQSLEASRVAYSLRKAEESLERERVLQVLKSSSGNGSSTSSLRNGSSSPPKATPATSTSTSSSEERYIHRHSQSPNIPTLPPRPRRTSPPRPPSSIADSVLSYEQVAKASVGVHSSIRSAPSSVFSSRSPERGRSRHTPDMDEPRPSSSSPSRHANISPPPMHPDRRPPPLLTKEPQESIYLESPPPPLSPPSPRISRSKSLHHPKPPPPPPARNSRRRPDSAQLSPASTTTTLPSAAPPSTPGPSEFPSLTRRFSVTSTHSRASSIDSTPSIKRNLKKTLSSLQPKLDAARFKAEAGLSRKGYVNHTTAGPATSPAFKNWAEEGQQRLIDVDGEDGVTVDGSSLSFDDDAESMSGQHDNTRHGRNGLERDEMKWPAGEGWNQL